LGILFGSPYGLIGDGIWGSELALLTDSDPVSKRCLGYETAHPALLTVLSKIVVFAIFVGRFLRNKLSAPGDKSTAKSDINLFELSSGYIFK
jgi:hypothetical protein